MDINDRKNLLNMFNEREPDEKLLFSKVLNQASLCEKNHDNYFTDFLDPYRANKFISAFKTLKNFDLCIKAFGGNGDAERLVIGFSPDYVELENGDFPIAMLKIKYDARFAKQLTHRDFLGSIIGLGIDRVKVGDIILKEDYALAYVYKDIAEYIAFNLEKIGRSKVTNEICGLESIISDKEKEEEITIIASSLRIDTIVGNAFKLSRGKAAELICADKVFINWQPVKSVSKVVAEGDMITLRGKGRAKINKILGKSKKGRFIVSILK